jgi:hypothetical protein
VVASKWDTLHVDWNFLASEVDFHQLFSSSSSADAAAVCGTGSTAAACGVAPLSLGWRHPTAQARGSHSRVNDTN